MFITFNLYNSKTQILEYLNIILVEVNTNYKIKLYSLWGEIDPASWWEDEYAFTGMGGIAGIQFFRKLVTDTSIPLYSRI